MDHVYSDIKNKEDRNTSLLLTIMSEPEESNKVNEEIKDSHDNDDNNQPILQQMIAPSDLNDIEWNWNEVGFDPNGRWSKVICNYKLFQGEIIREGKTG